MATWEPREGDLDRVIAEQNPWHATRRVPVGLTYPVQRGLAQQLWRAVCDHPAPALRRSHLILGARRVGKTTVMYQTVQQLLDRGMEPRRLWWLRMDHPLLMQRNLGDLVRRVMTESDAGPGLEVVLFLDELVYSQDWDLWLKTFHDERWPVRVIATSSATAALHDRHLESGVGRWIEHFLTPYQFAEFLALSNVDVEMASGPTLLKTLEQAPASQPPNQWHDLLRRFMLVGGFPELLLADRDPSSIEETTLVLQSQQRLRDEAVERAIYKDIPQSFNINHPMELERLLYTLAGQMTGILSPTSAGQDLGLSQATFDRYVAYLERTFMIFRISNYVGNESTRQRRGRKVFFYDGAVRNAALQRGLVPLADPAEAGVLQENLVASALWSLAQHTSHRLSYWRDGKDEVDFVLDQPDGPVAFEVASSTSHHARGLLALTQRYPSLRGRSFLVVPNVPFRRPDLATGRPGSISLSGLLVGIGLFDESVPITM